MARIAAAAGNSIATPCRMIFAIACSSMPMLLHASTQNEYIGSALCNKSASSAHAPIAVDPSSASCFRRLATAQLQELLQNASTATPVTGAVRVTGEAAFNELARRKELKPSGWRDRIRLAFNDWDWATLDRLQKQSDSSKYLSGVVLPTNQQDLVESRLAPGLWHINATGSTDHQLPQLSALRTGEVVLAIVHPNCGYCRQAAQAIERDARLRRLLSHCGVWASFVDVNFDIRMFEQWASMHPTMRPVVIKDWSAVGLPMRHETPVFHLLRHGQVVETITGWPGDMQTARLVRAITSNGMSRACGQAVDVPLSR